MHTTETRGELNAKPVAFCGTRGVPANYGGFETTVDEISKRFVKSGYECVVFCRESSAEKVMQRHEGRKLVYVKGSSSPKLDTFVSAVETGWHLLHNRGRYSFVFWFNNANLPGILFTLLARIPMAVNTNGMEWRRPKWSPPFKAYYLIASLLVSLLCRNVISDSTSMQSYYRKVFRKETYFIPYGIPESKPVSSEKSSAILKQYGLEPSRYFLQITRFEPDNLVLDNVLAFRAASLAKEGFKLLLIGYKPPGTPYAQQVKAMSGKDGVLVANAVYDAEVLNTLRSNCFCYVHGNTVGGTNPALLEAMASCPRIFAVDVPFSREVLGPEGHFFSSSDMAVSLRSMLDCPDEAAAVRRRVRALYQWDAVARSYMRVAEGQRADYSPVEAGSDEPSWEPSGNSVT